MIVAIKDRPKKQASWRGIFLPNHKEFAIGKGEASKVLICAI